MKILSKPSVWLIIVLGVLFLSIIYLLAKDVGNNEQNAEPEFSSTEELEDTTPGTQLENPQKVNPEERNPLLQRAGLPYEIDTYAITYRTEPGEPSGVVLIVIDKSSASGVSPHIRNAALKYLADRGISEDDAKIEYRNRADAR